MRERIEDLGGPYPIGELRRRAEAEYMAEAERLKAAGMEYRYVRDETTGWFGEYRGNRIYSKPKKYIGREGIEAFAGGITEIPVKQLYLWVQEPNQTHAWTLLIYGDDTGPESRAFIEDLVVKPLGGERQHVVFLVKDNIQKQDDVFYDDFFLYPISLDKKREEKEWRRMIRYSHFSFTLTFLPGDPETINRRLEVLLFHEGWPTMTQYIIVPENSGLSVDRLKADRSLFYIPPVLELTGRNTLRFLYGGKLERRESKGYGT